MADLTSPSNGRVVRGGDGMLCHIDQVDGKYQMVSSQNGNWSLSTNNGDTFSGGFSQNGAWVNYSDFDSDTKILYLQTYELGDFYRWNVVTGDQELVDVNSFSLNITAVTVDENVDNRVYFGTNGGGIVRVDNANEGLEVDGTLIGSFIGNVASIDIEDGNEDHILITLSNYGVNSVYESKDGGDNWTSVEGNIPDMPVRWGIFSPIDASQALVATEAGVWATELLDGSNTTWFPPVPVKGVPLTRVDQLLVRRSDNTVLAATYGRGLFTTDIFMEPKADMFIDQIGYTGVPLRFMGDEAINASSWMWDFGDSSTSTEENTTHSYPTIGEYPVSLTINDDLITSSIVKVLPDRALPYQIGDANYGGDFEGNTEQYGVFTVNGSSFSRGNSTIQGKDGVHSGENAFVLGIDEEYYQNGTHSMVYIPNFNMEEESIYEFSFWAKFRLNNGYDGLRVEYSTDRGQSWDQLGSTDDSNWYNFKNNNLDGAGFDQGASYFSGTKNGFVNYKLNISNLSGNKDVAFRFVFKAGATGNFRGIAIDDIEITKYDGELKTDLLSFSGEYTEPTEITLTWLTQPEYHCYKFEVERSINGFDFEEIETIFATGGTSTDIQSYDITTLAQRSLYFYRIKVINENNSLDYNYEFYSPTIVMRKNLEGTSVRHLFPNPIEDQVFLTFTDIIEGGAIYEMYAVNGKLVTKGVLEDGLPTGTINVPASLTSGVYILNIQVGDGEPQTFKLLKN
jgi:hypothetical protein